MTPATRKNLFIGLMALALLATLGIVIYTSMTVVRQRQAMADAEHVELLRRDAQQFLNNAQFKEAETLAQELLKTRPDDPESHLLMAEVLVGQKRYAEAYANAAASLKIDSSRDESQFFAGAVASQLERWEEAALHHAEAARLNPQSAKYALHLATAHLKLGRMEEAETEALRARALDSSAPDSYLLLAQVADRRSQLLQAIAALDEGLAVMRHDDPKYVEFTVYKAQLFRRADRPGDAVNLLTGLPPRRQQEESVVHELAQSYARLGEPYKAAAVWAERFSLHRTNARAAAEAGYYLLRAGDTAQARRYLSYAQSADPRDPAVAALTKALNEAR